MRAVIYTGGTPLGKEVAAELLADSWEVMIYESALDIPGTVSCEQADLLILVGGSKNGLVYPDGEIGTERDYSAVAAYLAEQMWIRCQLIDLYMPALQKGQGKRIGFISYRYASISDNQDAEDYALHMDAAGMSMQAKMVHEKYGMTGKGSEFTVRYFAAETDRAERQRGISAAQYLLLDFSQDHRYDPRHYEENHLRMRDHKFVQIPW